jgi:hypothetical protein
VITGNDRNNACFPEAPGVSFLLPSKEAKEEVMASEPPAQLAGQNSVRLMLTRHLPGNLSEQVFKEIPVNLKD